MCEFYIILGYPVCEWCAILYNNGIPCMCNVWFYRIFLFKHNCNGTVLKQWS